MLKHDLRAKDLYEYRLEMKDLYEIERIKGRIYMKLREKMKASCVIGGQIPVRHK